MAEAEGGKPHTETARPKVAAAGQTRDGTAGDDGDRPNTETVRPERMRVRSKRCASA